jgi:toxin-antitoxin system PIN domain toxin
MIYLLDVNVLLALIDPNHPHHTAAVRFFPVAQKAGWATCPLVENAFIRILGRANYPQGPGSPELARQILLPYRTAPGHQFIPDDLSLCDLTRFPALPESTALTDLYLLALAVKHHARFATFDTGIDASLVVGGRQALHRLHP